ncbi:hypothetical protein ACFL1D_03555 [Candidatus Omnitrophota bacterium]
MRIREISLLSLMVGAVMLVEAWSIFRKPAVKVNREIIFQEEQISEEPPAEVIIRPMPEEKMLVKAVPEKLDLELLGTAIVNIKDPAAFIKDLKTGRQGVYRLGNSIRQARVVKIAMGEVTLEKEGRRQVLRLSSRGRKWADAEKQDLPVISVSGNDILVNRSSALNQAGQIFKALSKVKVRPYYQSDKIAGMMIDGIEEGSIIEQAGIRNLDVINTVNNQRIDSYQKALQVFKKARNQGQVTISLLRQGENKQLCYRLEN